MGFGYFQMEQGYQIQLILGARKGQKWSALMGSIN